MAATIRRTSPQGIVIAVRDIDGLKAFNDGNGHVAGDATLLDPGQKLRGVAGGTDIAARIGGDPLIRGGIDGSGLTAGVGVA